MPPQRCTTSLKASSSQALNAAAVANAATRVCCKVCHICPAALHNIPEGLTIPIHQQQLPILFAHCAALLFLHHCRAPAALHNIPEGLVIAAPLYAATGSKLTALGATAASGLSEPVGALLALLVFKPFVTSLAQLDYVLAATGGVMLSVCVLELWPEGRRCGQDVRLWQGIALGTVVMGWTLYVGV